VLPRLDDVTSRGHLQLLMVLPSNGDRLPQLGYLDVVGQQRQAAGEIQQLRQPK